MNKVKCTKYDQYTEEIVNTQLSLKETCLK